MPERDTHRERQHTHTSTRAQTLASGEHPHAHTHMHTCCPHTSTYTQRNAHTRQWATGHVAWTTDTRPSYADLLEALFCEVAVAVGAQEPFCLDHQSLVALHLFGRHLFGCSRLFSLLANFFLRVVLQTFAGEGRATEKAQKGLVTRRCSRDFDLEADRVLRVVLWRARAQSGGCRRMHKQRPQGAHAHAVVKPRMGKGWAEE